MAPQGRSESASKDIKEKSKVKDDERKSKSKDTERTSKVKREEEKSKAKDALDLTIGCELEFVLVTDLNQTMNGKEIVREILREWIEFRCSICHKEHKYTIPIWTGSGRDESCSTWEVGIDNSVTATIEEVASLGTDWNQYRFHDIEVRSRKIPYTKSKLTGHSLYPGTWHRNHEHEVSYDREIEGVVNHLRKRLSRFSSGTKTERYAYVNGNCGLHIHVGNGDKHFPLPTVKRIFSAFVACEKQIDRLHAQSRITGTDLSTSLVRPMGLLSSVYPSGYLITHNVYNKPPSLYFTIAAYNRRHLERANEASNNPRMRWRYDVDAWLALIREASTLPALRELYNNQGRSCTINLQGLIDPDEPISSAASESSSSYSDRFNKGRVYQSPPTIEFRQHRGTLEASAIEAYIDFLARVVLHLHEMDDEKFYQDFGPDGLFRHPALNTSTLLEKIECSDETINYYNFYLSKKDHAPARMQELYFQASIANESIMTNPKTDPLVRLLFENAKVVLRDIDPMGVEACVSRKLSLGGYGLLRGRDLGFKFGPENEVKQHSRLRIQYNIKDSGEDSYFTPTPQREPSNVKTDKQVRAATAPAGYVPEKRAPSFVSPTSSLQATQQQQAARTGPQHTEQSEEEPSDESEESVRGPKQQYRSQEGSVPARPVTQLRGGTFDDDRSGRGEYRQGSGDSWSARSGSGHERAESRSTRSGSQHERTEYAPDERKHRRTGYDDPREYDTSRQPALSSRATEKKPPCSGKQ